jgi:hypothetical protein
MSEEIKKYLEHKSNHTLYSKLAAAHAAMLKAGSDHDAALSPALRAMSDARNTFHKACKEALEEKAGFSAAMLGDLEKSIIASNIEKLTQAASARQAKPNVDQRFAKLVAIDEDVEEQSLLR